MIKKLDIVREAVREQDWKKALHIAKDFHIGVTQEQRSKMAKKAMVLKQQKKQKYSTREYTRCKICGRPHSYLRKYGICRICFRELAYKGEIPGVRKASW